MHNSIVFIQETVDSYDKSQLWIWQLNGSKKWAGYNECSKWHSFAFTHAHSIPSTRAHRVAKQSLETTRQWWWEWLHDYVLYFKHLPQFYSQGSYRNLTVVFQEKITTFSRLFKAFCSSLC